jgi:sortase A
VASRHLSRVWRWLERLLVLTAVLAFGTVGVALVQSEWDSISARLALSAARMPDALASLPAQTEADSWRTTAAATESADEEAIEPAVETSEETGGRVLLGELEIARVQLSTLVFEVRDPAALRHAAGHVRGTSLPWQKGNTAVAGHRDSAFRLLRDVRPGDDIRFVTPRGTFEYRVTRAFAVYPKEVWVLDENAAALTLITCFPFRWLGTAPERWIIQASRAPS